MRTTEMKAVNYAFMYRKSMKYKDKKSCIYHTFHNLSKTGNKTVIQKEIKIAVEAELTMHQTYTQMAFLRGVKAMKRNRIYRLQRERLSYRDKKKRDQEKTVN